MDNIYNSIEEYSPNKECKILIADILSNKKLNPRVTELFIGGRKCAYLVFITVLFCCTENVRLNSTHYFIMKI